MGIIHGLYPEIDRKNSILTHMFNKPLQELNFQDIEAFVHQSGLREGLKLDFKEKIGNPDKFKTTLCTQVAPFANTAGGYLIIGINDKNYAITGVDSVVQNKKIDEWINQVISSNIEEKIFYPDPRLIEIPGSTKVLVVIYVPESMKKPHQVDFKYFTRVNDSTQPSNHYLVRDMFDFRRRRTDEIEEFLRKRNLLDNQASDFTINTCSSRLYQSKPSRAQNATVVISILPNNPYEEKFLLDIPSFTQWLSDHTSGYYPDTNRYLFSINHNYEIKLEGILLKQPKGSFYSSYLEIQSNGYIEAGLPKHVIFNERIFDRSNANLTKPIVYLTPIIGYTMMLMGFTEKFYRYINYFQEAFIQISFANVLKFKLYGLHQSYHLDEDPRYRISDTANLHHNNFKVIERFNSTELSRENIESIVQRLSQKICQAFGLEKDFAFKDGSIDTVQFRSFDL